MYFFHRHVLPITFQSQNSRCDFDKKLSAGAQLSAKILFHHLLYSVFMKAALSGGDLMNLADATK